MLFRSLYNTLGFDPLPDDFEGNALPQLTERVRVHLKATEEDSLRMTSNLFGYAPAVSVRLVGVDDPVMNVRMKAQISELLTRNQVDIDTPNGLPMTFSLQRERKDGLEKANWSIMLQDAKGSPKGSAQQTSTMPENARNSAYEASLVAAVTSKLPQLRSWLAELAQETKQ